MKKNHTLLFILSICVCSVVLSGCQIPFTNIVIPIPFIEKRPEDVISKAISTMASLQTVHFASDVYYKGYELPMTKAFLAIYGFPGKFIAERSPNTTVQCDMNIQGVMDFKDAANYKNASDFTTKLSFNSFQGNVSGSSKTIGSDMYVKINSLPTIQDFKSDPKIVSQWIKISKAQELAQNLFEKGIIGTTFKKLRENILEKKESAGQDQSQLKQILVILNKNKAGKQLPDETINNIKTYHYTFDLDAESISQILASAISSAGTPTSQASFQKIFSQIQEAKGEIWIGTKDYYVHRFLTYGKAKSPADPNATVDFKVMLNFSQFNNSVQIDAPENTLTIDEFVTDSYLQELSSGTSAESINSLGKTLLDNLLKPNDIDEDSDGLNTAQENEYHTNPQKSDTDEDGFSDGDEVRNGYNPNGPGKL